MSKHNKKSKREVTKTNKDCTKSYKLIKQLLKSKRLKKILSKVIDIIFFKVIETFF